MGGGWEGLSRNVGGFRHAAAAATGPFLPIWASRANPARHLKCQPALWHFADPPARQSAFYLWRLLRRVASPSAGEPSG